MLTASAPIEEGISCLSRSLELYRFSGCSVEPCVTDAYCQGFYGRRYTLLCTCRIHHQSVGRNTYCQSTDKREVFLAYHEAWNCTVSVDRGCWTISNRFSLASAPMEGTACLVLAKFITSQWAGILTARALIGGISCLLWTSELYSFSGWGLLNHVQQMLIASAFMEEGAACVYLQNSSPVSGQEYLLPEHR